MPSGSTQTNSVTPNNSGLNSLFTSLFSGANGAGATAIGTLSSIAKGSNITSLNNALTSSNATTFASSIGQIKEAFGSSGVGSSSALAKTLSTAATQNNQNLTTTLASADLSAQQQQLSASSFLSQIFSGAATQYFNSGSSSSSFNPLQLFSTLFPGGL